MAKDSVHDNIRSECDATVEINKVDTIYWY
jgi:hypothetical protein